MELHRIDFCKNAKSNQLRQIESFATIDYYNRRSELIEMNPKQCIELSNSKPTKNLFSPKAPEQFRFSLQIFPATDSHVLDYLVVNVYNNHRSYCQPSDIEIRIRTKPNRCCYNSNIQIGY